MNAINLGRVEIIEEARFTGLSLNAAKLPSEGIIGAARKEKLPMNAINLGSEEIIEEARFTGIPLNAANLPSEGIIGAARKEKLPMNAINISLGSRALELPCEFCRALARLRESGAREEVTKFVTNSLWTSREV